MHCSNNNGQQNFPGLKQEREQPHLSHPRDTGEAIETGDWTVTFVWVKAHAGILGNEMANQMAKTAARNEDMTTSFSRIPLRTLFRELEEESKLKWQQSWKDSPKEAQTKLGGKP